MTPWRFDSFEHTGRSILRLLQQRLGFDLWMITRVEGDLQIVLQVEDHGFGLQPGQTFHWADTFCSRMVRGEGPAIAPRAQDVPCYAHAAQLNRLNIQAYIGTPLRLASGELFGTLCAIDDQPHAEGLRHEQALIEFMAALLTHSLHAELARDEQQRQLEHLQAQAMTDGLTGVYNRAGWNHVLALEEAREHRYGDRAAVYIIDLDGLKALNDREGHAAGDALIQQAARVLQQHARHADVVARLGGDEFAVLALNLDPAGAEQLQQRLQQALEQAGVEASIGWALRTPQGTLQAAMHTADQQMYQHKRQRKAQA